MRRGERTETRIAPADTRGTTRGECPTGEEGRGGTGLQGMGIVLKVRECTGRLQSRGTVEKYNIMI